VLSACSRSYSIARSAGGKRLTIATPLLVLVLPVVLVPWAICLSHSLIHAVAVAITNRPPAVLRRHRVKCQRPLSAFAAAIQVVVVGS